MYCSNGLNNKELKVSRFPSHRLQAAPSLNNKELKAFKAPAAGGAGTS